MSRLSRAELVAQELEQVRGWNLDQDLLDEALAAYWGINRTEGRVIDIVDRAGRISAGQLGAEVRLTSGAVTAVVDRLEAAGLVRRVRDTVDRRRVFIEVTPKTEALAAPIFGPMAEEGYRVMAAYTDAELELINGFISASRELLKRHSTRIYDLIEQGKQPQQ
jgi:DNA-binding MarR family transcriptional regulator